MTPPTPATFIMSWDPRRSPEGPSIPVTRTLWAALAAVAYGPAEAGPALDPLPFHAVNLILHALAAMVVYVLLLRLVAHAWGAWVGAALFALLFAHTLRVNRKSFVGNVNLADVLRGEVASSLRRGDRYGTELKFDAATSYYRLALRTRPDDPQALLGLADLLAMSDKPGEALVPYERVMRLRGASADLHRRIARVYDRRQDHEQARFHLNEALRLEPQNADAKAGLTEPPRTSR